MKTCWNCLRAWERVFPRLIEEVPSFTCESFYPHGWRQRQYADLAAVLDNEPDTVDVALDGAGRPVGWVCTRLHPQDNLGEVFVLGVDPEYQRLGVGRALMEHSFIRIRAAGLRMVMVETGDDRGHAPGPGRLRGHGFHPLARRAVLQGPGRRVTTVPSEGVHKPSCGCAVTRPPPPYRIWQLLCGETGYGGRYIALAGGVDSLLVTCDCRLATGRHHATIQVHETCA